MTSAATLILASPGPPAPGFPSGQTPLLGLALVRRSALAAARAGFDRIFVLGDASSPAGSSLDGTAAVAFPGDAGESALPPGRIVLLSDRVVASPQWLRGVLETPVEPGRLHRFGAGAILQTSDPALLARALTRDARLADIVSAWAAAIPAAPAGLPAGVPAPFEMTRPEELAAAETLLLKGLVKKEDGILTRLVSRKISLAVTRRVARTPVTPDLMTVVSVTLGLAGAWCFLSPTLPRQAAGGLLFLLHSILDGCDGELARVKFRESRRGGILDFWGDNLVHVGVFSAFAVAWSTASGRTWPLYLGAMAVSGTILCAAFVYTYAMRPRPGGGPVLTTLSPLRRSRLAQVLDALARRDFIYFVAILAFFGKAYWFLAPVSVGTLAFFFALLVMAFGGRGRGGVVPGARARPEGSVAR